MAKKMSSKRREATVPAIAAPEQPTSKKSATTASRFYERPVFRRLRVFPFDPESAADMSAAVVNEVTFLVPWEVDRDGNDLLQPGPVGEYVEVIDQDEGGTQMCEPINLDDPHLLAADGHAPVEGNLQFHQQMLYAVSMRTIATFERALGRRAHWGQSGPGYVRRLRLYPHYQQMENAYFNPSMGVCFGYFTAGKQSPAPGTTVYSCLSQHIIAHEVAHALLLGMHVRVDVPDAESEANPDLAAFHEGFCDLVALLQQFAMPEVVRHQLAMMRGELSERSELWSIARQFAQGMGMSAGIRNAFGSQDGGVWKPAKPQPEDYETIKEPHQRGFILVRAVLDAFQKIYRARVADLLRIATEGTGVLPAGDLHPDLVQRLAKEAATSARHVLDMCVRALDYCPAIDLHFGDFLRAILTADVALQPYDVKKYRVAFVEAFRRHGILPRNVATLSAQSMLWPRPPPSAADPIFKTFICKLARQCSVWELPQDREEMYAWARGKADELEGLLKENAKLLRGALGAIDTKKPFRVHSLWPRERVGPDGQSVSQWIVQIIQERGSGNASAPVASCAVLVDADSGQIRFLLSRCLKAVRNAASQEKTALAPKAAESGAPVARRLRVFAFDPSMDTQIDTMGINQITLRVPWEKEPLKPGPIGEYVEVIDHDPASGCFYTPVDLNDPYLLATDGHAPSQGNPQFHQQMVYAVAMRTIRNFERALGRLALWSAARPHYEAEDDYNIADEQFVRKLRLYPHALREANAYYSPRKKAVLFGYFQTGAARNGESTTVFSCLSHDIIAHEVTHALLDGMHRRFAEPSNPDVLAFHEAFADLVALLQHFSIPEVLKHQIAATRGDLSSQSRLGELAQEFGSAIGQHGALRSAIGQVNPDTGQWKLCEPDPEAYRRELEPHARGALLVATIFDAFLTIYRLRVADLLRIASKGSGVLPAGQLHPDLVNRLAGEAAAVAQQILDMCIRALDYCPPVDLTFGDYLRAVITADFEFDPTDSEHRRAAIIDAFRRHGIVPEDVRAFSEEGLLWKPTRATSEEQNVVLQFIQDWSHHISSWNLSEDREVLFEMMRDQRQALHGFLAERHRTLRELNIIDTNFPFEIHSLRPAKRIDWRGNAQYQWIVEITQKRPQWLAPADTDSSSSKPDYWFRGGATLLIDATTGRVRYSIRKRMDDEGRLRGQRDFMRRRSGQSLYATYSARAPIDEPFAVLHRF